MINAILGTKLGSTQRFTEKDQRIPVTRIKAGPCLVTEIKTKDKDGYDAIQLGWGKRKMEIRLKEKSDLKKGDQIKVAQVFKTGDKIKVTGWSKGKGFTGVVKRWGFKGGPRTHGQSDRERSPGSIGMRTIPGRVNKDKKMPGRAGNDRVTVAGLKVVSVDEKESILAVKGLVPGANNGLLIIRKTNA